MPLPNGVWKRKCQVVLLEAPDQEQHPQGGGEGACQVPPTSWCPDIIHPLHAWAVCPPHLPPHGGGRLQSAWMLLSQKWESHGEDTGEELPLLLCLQGIQPLGL